VGNVGGHVFALRRKAERWVVGATDTATTIDAPQRVINLMEALRRSVDEDKRQVPPRRGRSGNLGAQTGLNVMPQRAATRSAG
jgi:hypothetical protein